MENKELNINEVVRVDTLPVIFQQLELVGSYVDGELLKVKELECTEENKNEVKKIRANINSLIKQFEDKRKEIKKQVLDPYNQFNDKYEEEVKIKLEEASAELKTKIDDIENEQLKEKSNEVCDFITENIDANHLRSVLTIDEVIEYGKLKINLSTSLKSLKEDAKTFIERVANEVKLIELEDTPSNLLYEYGRNGFDLTKAKLTLIERQREIEELAKKREQVEEVVVKEEEIAEYIEEITAPKEVIQEDEILEVTFTVRGTKPQLLEIKRLIVELGVEYK